LREKAVDLTKPILITGASGKTGRRAMTAIAKKGGRVRAFVRRPEAGAELRAAGAAEIAQGDLTDSESLRDALSGVGQVLHICPPMHPKEDTIAATMIDLSRELSIERFVLYSVLHPLLEDVPHHGRKLQAERYLINSGLDYTILQPSRYMQHLLPIWSTVLKTGLHAMPFDTAARFSVVDLADLAEATGRILTEPGHESATYQLAGPVALSQDDMARILTEILARPVRAAAKPLDEFRREAASAGMPAERIETMCMMNAHYSAYGLIGNPNVLRWILGREPTRFQDFVARELSW
jgi:uncharacterized protein YbjT (DUF2867 family)